eukprot:403349189
MENLDVSQEALLKKRKRDDENQRKRLHIRAQQRMEVGRKKKMEDKETTGKKILMPEVFISNYMKQQRNYQKYKREKGKTSKIVDGKLSSLNPNERMKANTLILAVRVKQSDNTTPQAQKILRTLGLKELNNAVLLKSDPDTEKQLIIIQDYIAYGYPTKQVVNDLIRKRGNIKKEGKRLAISDNNLIEELLGAHGIICLEDLIDSAIRCNVKDSHFEEVRQVLWPFQLTPQQETSDKTDTKRKDTGKVLKKKDVKVEKGGYLGLMGEKINDFVKPLI